MELPAKEEMSKMTKIGFMEVLKEAVGRCDRGGCWRQDETEALC